MLFPFRTTGFGGNKNRDKQIRLFPMVQEQAATWYKAGKGVLNGSLHYIAQAARYEFMTRNRDI